MRRDLIWLCCGLGFMVLLLGVLFSKVRSEERDRESLYSTMRSDPKGTRAFWLLSQRLGYKTKRLKRRLLLLETEPGRLLFLLGASKPNKAERRSLLSWVKQGNTLVVACTACAGMMKAFKVELNMTRASPVKVKPKKILRKNKDEDLGGFTESEKSEMGESSKSLGEQIIAMPGSDFQLWMPSKLRWFSKYPKRSQVLLHNDGKAKMLALRVGQGQVLLSVSPGVFSNRGLAKQDNVWFATNVLRLYARNAPVMFDEFHHGFRFERTMLDYLRHRGLHTALLQLVVLLFLLLWWGGKRFGPLRQHVEESFKDAELVTLEQTEALAWLYAGSQSTAQVAQMMAWDLRHSLVETLGGRVLQDPLLIVGALQQRGASQAASIPALLQRLEEAASGQRPTSEKELLSWAHEIDALKSQLSTL